MYIYFKKGKKEKLSNFCPWCNFKSLNFFCQCYTDPHSSHLKGGNKNKRTWFLCSDFVVETKDLLVVPKQADLFKVFYLGEKSWPKISVKDTKGEWKHLGKNAHIQHMDKMFILNLLYHRGNKNDFLRNNRFGEQCFGVVGWVGAVS